MCDDRIIYTFTLIFYIWIKFKSIFVMPNYFILCYMHIS